MVHPFFQDKAQIGFGNGDQPDEALAPNRADHAFADCIRVRAVRRGLENGQPEPAYGLIQVLGEDGCRDPEGGIDNRPRSRWLPEVVAASRLPSGKPSRSRSRAPDGATHARLMANSRYCSGLLGSPASLLDASPCPSPFQVRRRPIVAVRS